MKFLTWSSIICVVSFTLCGIFFGYADFKDIEKNFESGKYSFNYSSDGEDKEKDFGERTETYKSSEVKKIEIKSSISEVIVKSGNVEKIKMNVKFLNEEVEKNYSSSLVAGVLKVSVGEDSNNQSFSSFFGSKKNGCKISIIIPKNLELDYNFALSLGALEMKNVNAGQFEAKLAAGNVEIENMNFQSALIKAAAGNIELDGVQVVEQMEIKAAAGNVEIEFAQPDPHLKVKAAAGNVEISFDNGVEPNLNFKSLSTVGELSVRKGYKSVQDADSTYTYGQGKGFIEVKSTFGNVELK